jgi:hypothetical protein
MKIINVKISKSLTAIFLITIMLILPFNSISSSSLIKQTIHKKDKELIEKSSSDNDYIINTQRKSPVRNEKLIILGSLIKIVKKSFAFDNGLRFFCNQALNILCILPDVICMIILFLLLPIVGFLSYLMYHPNYFIAYYARIVFAIIMIIYLILCGYPYYYINSKTMSNDSIISDTIISSNLKRCPCLLQS